MFMFSIIRSVDHNIFYIDPTGSTTVSLLVRIGLTFPKNMVSMEQRF
jgi:hypothetical protein